MRVLRRWTLGSFLLVAASLAACAGGRGTLLSAFRGQVVAASWTPSGPVEMYNRKNLFSLMNGQSETFFVYGFQLVALQTFRNAENTELGIQVWQVATPADAPMASFPRTPAALRRKSAMTAMPTPSTGCTSGRIVMSSRFMRVRDCAMPTL
jgi:hypothetical protein